MEFFIGASKPTPCTTVYMYHTSPRWGGFPSSIARQTKRVPTPNDTSSESSRRDVSNIDPLWHRHYSNCGDARYRAWKVGSGVCDTRRRIRYVFPTKRQFWMRFLKWGPPEKTWKLGVTWYILYPYRRCSRPIQGLANHYICDATDVPSQPLQLRNYQPLHQPFSTYVAHGHFVPRKTVFGEM